MSRHERNTVLVLLALLLLGFLVFFVQFRHTPSMPPPKPGPETPTMSSSSSSSSSAIPASSSSSSASAKSSSSSSTSAAAAPKPAPTKPAVPTSATGAPVPPKIQLHKELIPKDISIVRCYYAQDIVPPGFTFGFDINGSGFTTEFQKMIKVESGVPGISVKNLSLVTANQIHGEWVVSPEAKTAFVYPRVLIQNLPVFTAPEPFAVVRKGEVLTILFISMESSGRAGRFRVITNLDEEMAKQFRVEPSTAGLDISDIQGRLPFAMEGLLQISQRLPTGDYGLSVFLGPKQIFKRDGMIKIVRPNVGQSGFVQHVMAAEMFHRPGDHLMLYVQGTGMSAQDANALKAKVNEFDMGQGSFTYISGVQMRLGFEIPAAAPVGSYGVTVTGPAGETLVEKKDVFQLVPADWIAGVRLEPAMTPGGKSTLRIIGRDLTEAMVNDLKIETDEPGITIGAPRWVDRSTAMADITVNAQVAPGDYWMHLSVRGQKIKPPYGTIIKILPN